MTELNLLILADPHAHRDGAIGAQAVSKLSCHPNCNGPNDNPIIGAKRTIKETKLKVDFVICPGDLGDKNDAVAAQWTWQTLDQLKRDLGAKELFGTVGNHDLGSRRMSGTNPPEAHLKNFVPKFPASSGKGEDQYWTKGYAIRKFPGKDTSFVLLNTCSLHGLVVEADADAEFQRGSINNWMLSRLSDDIQKITTSTNILIMHHHAVRHPLMDDSESATLNGERLVQLLKTSPKRWLIVHGHHHLPRLFYSDADLNSPVVLSAASIAAPPYEVMGASPRNQMHLVSVDVSTGSVESSRVKGKIRSWTWAPTQGWKLSTLDQGLPWTCGFAYTMLL